MRERTLRSLFDKIMWYGIYLFPLIAYVALLFTFQFNGSNAYVDFASFMGDLGFDHGVVYEVVVNLFSDGGIVPMADELGFIAYANYLVFVTILHVVFDTIVFIPRWFHNFLDKLEGGRL